MSAGVPKLPAHTTHMKLLPHTTHDYSLIYVDNTNKMPQGVPGPPHLQNTFTNVKTYIKK